ncbi:ribosomal protein S18-alanine N-acetyltransferase [Weissella diestrammenae]|uniref:Ribosomal protein S18-alanine N-acetyltransferase n=1 Tax=Weissella diestrammenae TaxID=1162633 RepID=A0A7G9T6U3_9LACO|nr:ribosomal protein S18-alanine N-acetyltransferase [Weissella diestrammenae]MCM0582593.1 ribosomal protein S18-alanine N-acetyltransferase [Weissella diestrammenae]QNN75818.1 ribosomal protein S18-alanine N-acetyltransferase [Weissella diestrammenae]
MLKKLNNWWRWYRHPLPTELREFHQSVVIDGIEYDLMPAQLAHAEAMLAVERDAYFGQEPWPIELFWNEINRQHERLYLIVQIKATHTTVAYIGTAFRPSLREVHITNLAVNRQWQKRGLGKFMLSYIMSVAAQIQFETVSLEVRMTNQAAQKLYSRLGFRKVRTKHHYYDDGEDAVEMRSTLGKGRL